MREPTRYELGRTYRPSRRDKITDACGMTVAWIVAALVVATVLGLLVALARAVWSWAL